MRVYVDHTHVWRAVTGLERIALQLFSPQALAPLDVITVGAHNLSGMLLKQKSWLAGASSTVGPVDSAVSRISAFASTARF